MKAVHDNVKVTRYDWHRLVMILVLKYLFGVAVAKYAVDGVPAQSEY